ncbi:MAG TPA: hypothetical protein PK313_14510 [Myxococcota bacterium]|nr:hypothetical protein [Myxococcota bacterium]
MRMLGIGAALLVLAAMAGPARDAAAKVTTDRVGAAVQRTTMDDFMRHPADGRYYTESWTTILHSDAGHVLYINFMYSNIGVVSGRAAVDVSLTEPDGQGRHFGWESDQADFRQDPETGRITIARDSITLKNGNLHILIDHSDLRLDVRMKAWMPGVKYHDGIIWLNDERSEFVQAFFHIPRGDFTAEAAMGGRRFSMKGGGYLDHMVNNRLSSEWSDKWWTTRFYAPDHTVAFWAFRLRKDRGGQVIVRSLVTDRTKVLAMTDRLKIKGEEPVADPKIAGRKYDTKYRLTLDRKGLKLEGELKSRRVHDRNAVVERLPWAQRNIAKMFAGNPVIYRMEGDANLVLTLEGQEPVTLTGTALMESIVN